MCDRTNFSNICTYHGWERNSGDHIETRGGHTAKPSVVLLGSCGRSVVFEPPFCSIVCSQLQVSFVTNNFMQDTTMALMVLMMVLSSTLGTAQASRQLRQAPDCGAAGAPCGASLSSKCHSSGPGYCQTGLFCGWNAVGDSKQTVCMPVPAECGRPGKSCCPGNAKAPITDGNKTPNPTCDTGYCFYTPTLDASGWSGPPFASPAGSMLGTCRALDLTCGSAAGKSCCPSLYKTCINPALPASITSMPGLCSGQLFCNTTTTTDAAGRYWPQGVCVANKPDCGAFGKSCCIQTSGVATSTVCGPTWGVGYCTYPGGKSTGDMRDMVCTQCPPVSVVAADPSKYFGCKSM